MLLNSFLCYRSCIYLLQSHGGFLILNEFTGCYAYLKNKNWPICDIKEDCFIMNRYIRSTCI